MGDTFLDTSSFAAKDLCAGERDGPLGRIWNIGPQKTLYLPGPWLHAGANDVVVFDLEGKPGGTVAGKAAPDLGPAAAN